MAVLSEIKSSNWQIATEGAGIVAEGLADIRQCIDVILRTAKGTDALRPQFGSDIYQHVDKPVNQSIPNIKRSIIEALEIWEKRVKLVRITHRVENENVQFFIYYSLVDEDVTDTLQLYLRSSDVILTPAPPQANQLILHAAIPSPYQQLMIKLVLDGIAQQPQPPVYGFATPQEMYSWAVNNWGFLGAWYLRPTEIYLFVNRGFAATGFIEVTSLALNKYVFDVPEIQPGQQYLANVVTPSDLRVGSVTADNLGNILDYLNSSLSRYGLWVVEALSENGDFSPVDFNSSDFNTVNTIYHFALLTTVSPAPVDLVITIV